jgi:LPS-assembly lipoprotein
MWWHERRNSLTRAGGLALALTLSGLLGGCFEPLYAERTFSGKPGLRNRLNAVAVDQILAASATPESRIAVAIRNSLLFNLTGGGETPPATHRLKITISPFRQQVIVDFTTARPDVEMVGFQANYSLTEIATNKVVMTGSTFSRAAYDIPGQEQRFAGARGLADAQLRSAKVIADNITARLASYFAAGT